MKKAAGTEIPQSPKPALGRGADWDPSEGEGQ